MPAGQGLVGEWEGLGGPGCGSAHCGRLEVAVG